MLSKEENERLTRVGPGTPCGELLRRYWQPVAIASELTREKPKQRVKIMGEELVVFKDDSQARWPGASYTPAYNLWTDAGTASYSCCNLGEI